MKVSHLVIAVLAAIVVALAGNLFAAEYSARGFEALNAHKIRIEKNLQELTELNERLQGEVALLTRSSDTVRVEARALGYYRDDETVVRIQDAGIQPKFRSPGRIILAAPHRDDRRSLVRVISAVAGFVVFLVLMLTAAPSHRSMSRPSR